jgi:hypothetical protein
MIAGRVRGQLACERAEQVRLHIPNPNIRVEIPRIADISVSDESVSGTR